MNTENQSGAVLSTSHERRRAGSSRRRTPTWLYVPLALVCLCLPLPADASDVAQAKWGKICEATPDTNCATFTQLPAGVIQPLADVSILEATRDSPTKMLNVGVHFQIAPLSQKGTVQVTVDAQPFADMPFVRCFDAYCVAQKEISAADVATFAGAKSFEIQSRNIKVSSPIGNFVEARTGRGMTAAEMKEQQERLQQELLKKAEEAKKKLMPKFLADAPAARPQEGFCAALKSVMAAAPRPDDFKSIMGAPDEFNKSVPDEFKESSGSDYSARISVPGSGKCTIFANKVAPSYTCTASFKLREVADKQMASLAQLVGKCLPDLKAERGNGFADFPRISFDNRKSKINVWIQLGETAGGDGGYDVDLWVDRGL